MLLLLLSLCGKVMAQDTTAISVNQFSNKADTTDRLLLLSPDSLITRKLKQLIFTSDSGMLTSFIPRLSIPAAPPSSSFVKWGGGYISYNWSFRSGEDSSVIDNNVSQHLMAGSFNATIAQTIPVRVTWFERHTNSKYFKDYRDITVDLDMAKYRQLKSQKALNNLKTKYQGMRNPQLPLDMATAGSKAGKYKSFLNDPFILRELIRSKETLIRKDFPDTSSRYVDSLTAHATKFIALYDSIRQRQTYYAGIKDSLSRIYQQTEAYANKIESLFSGKQLSVAETEELEKLYGSNDPGIQQLRQAKSGIRKLSVGRTYPNYSNLTLQNVNVNGINLEYARNHYYFAATAGLVDFRIRDFLYSQQKLPRQYVYAVRAGYGTRESDHIILTYFRGRKQLFGGNLQQPSTGIQGISLSGQFYIVKNIRVYGEVAQSGIPYALGGNNSDKPALALSDHSQRAYATGFTAQFPGTHTFAEGYYQHSGLNYQSFNSFQYNAVANSWSFRIDQSFWKQQLFFQAAFRKNDFINPLVLQRYNANTVFKSFMLSFRKYNWPIVSAGYIPASQYTLAGSQVYENHYQTFTGNISHQYRLGVISGSTLVSFSRFYNDDSDSGFVYYNSSNFFIGQTFLFNRFTASVNISGMRNGRHDMVVMEENISATFFKTINAGVGIKISNLNKMVNKIGFNAKVRASLKGIGELNLWMEQSYLPGLQQDFYKYQMFNTGLIRYFK